MSTRNPYHKMHKKEVFWQHHIDCWSQTTNTQAHYCRENGLSQSDFSKWKKKLKPHAKRNLRKRPFDLEHRHFSSKVLQSEKAHRCGFCAKHKSKVNKLFYGEDELVAICDYCLWHKARRLHIELPSYKVIRFEKCSVCFEDQSGVVIGNIYYQLCVSCLINSWREQFSQNPETHPCRNTCVGCNTLSPEKSMSLGAHIICNMCLRKLINSYIELSHGVSKCGFCHQEQTDNSLFGGGVVWICESCSEVAYKAFKNNS